VFKPDPYRKKENQMSEIIEETNTERDPGRWMALYSVIVAVLVVVLDGALMGLIAPAVAQDLGADAATIGLISSISMLMLAAFNHLYPGHAGAQRGVIDPSAGSVGDNGRPGQSPGAGDHHGFL
jgi:hypothetical protein